MLFHELAFAPFLFSTFSFFFFLKKYPKHQILFLLLASYFFYGWWNAKFLVLIIFSTFLDYFVGKRIHLASNSKIRKFYLSLSLLGNLGMLAYFKYANFFIESVHELLMIVGIENNIQTLNIILPIGISFYTFQTLSYSLDIYYKKLKPVDSLLNFMFYVAAFPQLVAGPIVRAREFLPQLQGNLYLRSNREGFFYIAYGLIKKLFIADVLGSLYVTPIFSNPTQYSSLELIFGMYCFAFQVFCDFSAYSDIAIGLGKVFGLELPVNFRVPYASKDPTEFWNRWHITFSTWLKDYLWIPLTHGLMRKQKTGGRYLFRNLLIVLLLGGLWHGANWTFIAWGLLHTFFFVMYYYLAKSKKSIYHRIPDLIKIFILFHLICLSDIFWRSPDLTGAFIYIKGIFQFTYTFTSFSWVTSWLLLGVAIGVHFLIEPFLKPLANYFAKKHWTLQTAAYALAVYFILGYGMMEAEEFIYFQF